MSTPFAIAVRCVHSQLLLLERTIQGASLTVVTNRLTLWLAVVAVRFQKPIADR